MTIRITVSDRVQYRVRGTINNETGAAEAFDFRVTARRLDPEALQSQLAESSRRIEDFLADVIVGWQGVVDAEGTDVPFSPAALSQLLKIPGLAVLIFKGYVAETAAKEKN
ncbi:MAG: hypothetical protein RL375_2436 [Pseudomonadota bacterium]|jgi:hypothetical protein